MVDDSTTDGDELTIREAKPKDADALGRLFEDSPDEGAVSFAPRFSHDPYEAYTGIRPDTTGFVATTPDGRLAGTGFVSLTDARFGGEIRPAALLNAIAVHPDFRGRGLGKRLARRRIEYARTERGPDCVAFANIQEGNDASIAVANSWADRFDHDFVMYPAEPIDSPETGPYDVHDADASERAVAVERSNAFYEDAAVYRPYDAEALDDRIETSPSDRPLHRYVVATRDGEVEAGAFVSEHHRVMALVVDSLPPALQDAEDLPPAIPESRALEMRMCADLWFGPDHPEAASALWQSLRADGDGANRIMLNFDPEGPVGDAVGITDTSDAMHLSIALAGDSIDGDAPFVAPLF